ncbi:hypothetical protein TUM17567_11440 [Citrobacter amalonaticus]|jgi:hypothetical protein|nr:hypothetical protein TUM17567_11440 [Citrobacter amalonaticus]
MKVAVKAKGIITAVANIVTVEVAVVDGVSAFLAMGSCVW